MLRLPSGLQSAAPTNTPGSAMAPRRSCHSAVRLISASLITLAMIVPENTPFGNVTCVEIRSSPSSHVMDSQSRRGTWKVRKIRERLRAGCTRNLPCSTCSNQGFPIALEHQSVGNIVYNTVSQARQLKLVGTQTLDCSFLVEFRAQHPQTEDEYC